MHFCGCFLGGTPPSFYRPWDLSRPRLFFVAGTELFVAVSRVRGPIFFLEGLDCSSYVPSSYIFLPGLNTGMLVPKSSDLTDASLNAYLRT